MRATHKNMFLAALLTVLFVALSTGAAPQAVDLKPEILKFDPFTWPSEIPKDCPFERSGAFTAIRFLGVKSGFRYGDTWYPSWAENDILYSPWTDGKTKRLDGDWKIITESGEPARRPLWHELPEDQIAEELIIRAGAPPGVCPLI